MPRSVPVYFVMDALDECPNDTGDLPSRSPRGKVLSVVKELVNLRLQNLHLCVTSRLELDIRTILKPLATQEISLHNESGQNRDINAYVTFVVQSVTKWRDDDKKMVIDKLTENADGMCGHLQLIIILLSYAVEQVSMGLLPIGGSATLFPEQSASYARGVAEVT